MDDIKKIVASYRISTSPHEIFKLLIKSHELNEALMWQTHADHRVLFTVSSFQLDSNRKKIRVTYHPSAELVDPEIPVYIKLPFRETVFKGSIVAQVKVNEIAVEVPVEIHMREFREVMRTELKAGERFVYLRPNLPGVRENKLITLKVFLKDISQKGLGIYVSETNIRLFKKGQLLELMGFDQFDLSVPLLGKVVYSERQHNSNRNLGHRVGVKMLTPIPDADYQKLFNQGKRSATQELMGLNVLSAEFREMLSKEVDATVGKMKKRPALSKYINQLEIVRNQDSYLSEHINVLTIICTFIARSMNWVSEASLEKFVYVSYIHDAPLFSDPGLAQIKSLKDFEGKKSTLSPAQQELYLRQPELAAEIAREDTLAPPDVEQMLLLQKELPNGQGLLGKGLSKITPMAALFIVAHDLTDEIMQNPNWSMDQWHRVAKSIYVGGPFNKILQELETAKVTLRR